MRKVGKERLGNEDDQNQRKRKREKEELKMTLIRARRTGKDWEGERKEQVTVVSNE